MIVEQNKWRATRYGAGAQLVNSDDYKQYSVQQTVDQLVETLTPTAQSLNCLSELESARTLPGNTGAERQLQFYNEFFSRHRVVEYMLAENDGR